VITLVLGGTRSGKSAVAEDLAARHGTPVTYVATMAPSGDPDLEARVAAHRRRRDPTWETVDAGRDLAGILARLRGTVLVDSLGPWVASATWVDASTSGADAHPVPDVVALCAALREREGDTVVVSDEVGLAVHPSTEQGRGFQNALGAVNHAVSAVAERAYLVVAGRPLALPPIGPPP
jgi:nicotinate-nucleotide--dimethylbenzimidazole phosphoribosyltransferase